jgi:hypothetical protein
MPGGVFRVLESPTIKYPLPVFVRHLLTHVEGILDQGAEQRQIA